MPLAYTELARRYLAELTRSSTGRGETMCPPVKLRLRLVLLRQPKQLSHPPRVHATLGCAFSRKPQSRAASGGPVELKLHLALAPEVEIVGRTNHEVEFLDLPGDPNTCPNASDPVHLTPDDGYWLWCPYAEVNRPAQGDVGPIPSFEDRMTCLISSVPTDALALDPETKLFLTSRELRAAYAEALYEHDEKQPFFDSRSTWKQRIEHKLGEAVSYETYLDLEFHNPEPVDGEQAVSLKKKILAEWQDARQEREQSDHDQEYHYLSPAECEEDVNESIECCYEVSRDERLTGNEPPDDSPYPQETSLELTSMLYRQPVVIGADLAECRKAERDAFRHARRAHSLGFVYGDRSGWALKDYFALSYLKRGKEARKRAVAARTRALHSCLRNLAGQLNRNQRENADAGSQE